MRAVSEWCVVLISGTVNACCGGMVQLASLMSSYGVIYGHVEIVNVLPN